jgi:hypothetical protein
MILAREFHVDPRAPLSWTYSDFYGALQLLTEERLGKAVRAQRAEEERRLTHSREQMR